jgi:hypothetical protein
MPVLTGEEAKGEEGEGTVRCDEEAGLPRNSLLESRGEELCVEASGDRPPVLGTQLPSRRVWGLTADRFPESADVVVDRIGGSEVDPDGIFTGTPAEDKSNIVRRHGSGHSRGGSWLIPLVYEQIN